VNEKISSVPALRGIAVLAVCMDHFLGPHGTAALPRIVREIASEGFLGVPLFFVISGFVRADALAASAE
jgi:peptidoglycan/LPS O-acetylase OafA/YrhL